MEFFQPILEFFNTQGPVPAVFGTYHIICLALTFGLTALAAICGRRHSAKTVANVVLITAIVVALFEIYKQINYTFHDGLVEPSYQWYAFPWQFCSTPMYIGLLAGIIRKGRIHDSLCCYLATYAVFAGLAVMIYPGDVFVGTTGINIQTVVCHGSMVVIGGYLYGSGHVKMNFKTVLKAMPVFAVCACIAVGLNEWAHAVGITENHNFNMFYVSPYKECTLPVYSLVHNSVPFPVNLAIYILGFTAAATVMMLGAKGIASLGRRSRKKEAVAA